MTLKTSKSAIWIAVHRGCEYTALARLLDRVGLANSSSILHPGASLRFRSVSSMALIESLKIALFSRSSSPICAHWAPWPVKTIITAGDDVGALVNDEVFAAIAGPTIEKAR